jgi:autotransporter-associated beta strand protein
MTAIKSSPTTALWLALVLLVFGAAVGSVRAQPDYANAHWNPPACVKWYTSGNGHDFCVIHDMEGYYEASIALLNTCGTNEDEASVYYLVESETDANDPAPPGDVTQSVREQYYAWHVVCWNTWMFGTEHEGFVSNPSWYTPAQYQASASIQRHLCVKYHIPIDRNHIIGHNEWQNPTWTNWMATNYPSINTTCNNHTDPGQYWNWTYFMNLISGSNGAAGTYWDRNSTAAGAGTVPNGVWDNFSTNWNSDSNGIAALGTWVGPNMAFFCAGTDSLSSTYTVTISETQLVSGIVVMNGNPTFNSGGLAFEGTNTYYTNYVAAGHTATFNTTFTGSGAPDKWGPGTAYYNSAANVSGAAYFTLNAGAIAVGNNAAFGSNTFYVGEPTGSNPVTLKSANSTAHTLANNLLVYATNFTLDVGGELTFGGAINWGTAAKTVTVNSYAMFSGAITNTGALTKAGSGSLIFAGATTNTYGTTTVASGTLYLEKSIANGAIPAAGVTVNTSGTLTLQAANQINDAAPMTLAGGTFATGAYNEQLGTLKLNATSTVDLGSGGVLKFAASGGVAWTGGALLNILGWNGSTNGGGSSQIFIGTSSAGLTATQIGQIQFLAPLGLSINVPARMLPTGEIVPVLGPPSITTQPQNQVALAGSSPGFTVAAGGTAPLGYQWFSGASPIAWATNSSMTLTNVSTNQSGLYSVVVSNAVGTASSSNALLSVYATAAASLNSWTTGGGRFGFGISGVPGYNYVVQSSSNLFDWLPLQTNPSPFIFTDQNATNPMEFYRVLYVP